MVEVSVLQVVTAALVIALASSLAAFGVRGTLIKGLSLYRRVRLLLLKARGKTEKGETEQRVVSGKAWDDFCDELKAAGAALVHGDAPMDPFNQVRV